MKRKNITFLILFPIFYILLLLFSIFYLDLANGPFIFLVLMLILMVCYLFIRVLTRNKLFRVRFGVVVGFLIIYAVILLSAKPGHEYKSAVNNSTNPKTDIIELNDGKIQGIYNDDLSVEVYAGIPFAKPPVGKLRWREPEDVDKWDGVRDCSYFRARSMQPDDNPIISSLTDIYAQGAWRPDYNEDKIEYSSEDSLYLNIWKPHTLDKNLPVLVYIHGGSLTTGSASFYSYNGENMAKHNIIQVNIQYRLGIFGYFASDELANESPNHTTGNYGLLDQIKALKWVNDNIEVFGGDKNNITICGESAGSSSVSAICASPLAKGLFQKAIGESSSVVTKNPPHTFRNLGKAKETGNEILKEFNCKNIDELRNIDATKLVNTKFKNDSMTIDGYALPKSPFEIYKDHEASDVAILNGFNSKEADPFTIPSYLLKGQPNSSNSYELLLNDFKDGKIVNELMSVFDFSTDEKAFRSFNDIISAYWFTYPHYEWNRVIADNYNSKTYNYYFDKENGYYGGYHSGELTYVFNTLDRNKSKKFAYDESDYALANIMNSLWASFIKDGIPSYNGLVWDSWDKDRCNLMHFGQSVEMTRDKFMDIYPILDKYYNNLNA